MNQSEKRFFRIESSNFKGGDTNYMEIFDFYDSLEKFDVNQEESFFKEMEIIHAAPAKNYLLNRILKSLRSLHETKNPKAELMIYYQNALIYLEKGLFDLYQKELEKMEAKSSKMGFFLFQVLASMEQDIVFVAKFNSERYVEGKKRFAKNIAILDEMRLFYDLKLLKNDLYFASNFKEYNELKTEAVQRFESLDADALSGFWTRFEFLKIEFIYNIHITQDSEGMTNSLKKIITLFMSNVEQAKAHLLLVIDYYYSYLHTLLAGDKVEAYLKERNQFNTLFQNLEVAPRLKSREKDVFYLHKTQLDLTYAYKMEEYQNCIDNFKACLDFLKENGIYKRVSSFTIIQMFLIPMQACVKIRKYENLTDFSNIFFNKFERKEHPQIQKIIHLYDLIGRYKNESPSLKSEFRKKIYYFQSINEYDEPIVVFISFVRKLLNNFTLEKKIEICRIYLNENKESAIDALVKWWVEDEIKQLESEIENPKI